MKASARENAEVATAWPDSCRQQAISTLQTSCGGSHAMAETLREFVPELGRTIGHMLEADPARLLEHLEAQEAKRRADAELESLLGEIRAVGSEART